VANSWTEYETNRNSAYDSVSIVSDTTSLFVPVGLNHFQIFVTGGVVLEQRLAVKISLKSVS
jgi:hypothetical protein